MTFTNTHAGSSDHGSDDDRWEDDAMSESGDSLDDGYDSYEDDDERIIDDFFFGSGGLLFGFGGSRGGSTGRAGSASAGGGGNNNNNSHLMGGGRIPIIPEDDYNSDYSDIDADSTPGQIGALLKNAVEHVGEFTFGGVAGDLPSIPGLEVEDYGPVTVPLMDSSQADRLAACGRVAPFGRGFETLVDPEVRRTWQFDAAQVKIANKAWDRGLAQLVSTMATRLGCPDMPLECHLYKLLLYGPGCHFVRHRDTEKEDRMFATLVIQLQSAHKGGELVVYQPDGTAVTHDFGAADGTGAFSPHYALHYADAEHELKPVTSGYRLALVYSICWPEGHKQIDLLQSFPAQQQLAKQFNSLSGSFFYIFEHQYTPASIGQLKLKALKGQDRARANMIHAANKLLANSDGFDLYLVRGERVVSTGPEDRGSRMQFPTWINVESGKQYESKNKDMYLGSTLINPERKRKRKLWAGESWRIKEDYTGNEGWMIDTVYAKYLLMGIPRANGPYALAGQLGQMDMFQLFDRNTITANDFNVLLSSVSSYLLKPMDEYRFRRDYGDPNERYSYPPKPIFDITVELFNIILARSLTECIPAYFAKAYNPLSAGIIPVYVRTMKDDSAMWKLIAPCLFAALPRAIAAAYMGSDKTDMYRNIAQLVIDASVAGVDQAVLDELSVVLDLVPIADVLSLDYILSRAAKHPRAWARLHAKVVESISSAPDSTNAFRGGVSLLTGSTASDLTQDQVAELVAAVVQHVNGVKFDDWYAKRSVKEAATLPLLWDRLVAECPGIVEKLPKD